MKNIEGVWLPDSENHLENFLKTGPRFAGGSTYQLAKYLACLPYVRTFGHAVDVGAHCGLWSRVMVPIFDKVTAFEPMYEHLQCLYKNIPVGSNFRVLSTCLGDHAGSVSMEPGVKSTGDTRIAPGDGGGATPITTLDACKLTKIDFLKIDAEGYEYFILKGGEETIRRDRPVIIVEQKPNKAVQYGIGDKDAVQLLGSWGAKLEHEFSGDFIMRWKP